MSTTASTAYKVRRHDHQGRLPQGTVSYETILLGYPAEAFRLVPVRKPLDVTWLALSAEARNAHGSEEGGPQ